ncbi:MAG: hypothetical protein ACFFED_06380 [Candidatus Thorarchaeota archaeon]
MFSKRKRSMIFTALLAWLVLSPFVAGILGSEVVAAKHSFTLAAIEITSPTDISFENGTIGKSIVWNATTENPKNFTVLLDGEVHLSDSSWDGELIAVNLDHLYEDDLLETLPAHFTYTCTVFNLDNETVSDTVEVEVIADVLAPIVVPTIDDVYGATNASFEVGSFGHSITWNITETNPSFYNITRTSNETTSNDTIIEFGSWDGSNLTITIDGLNASHWYMFTLFVNDTLGYNTTSSVNITIYPDLTAPVISSPDDISYEFGDTGYQIIWFTYDSNPLNYSLQVLVHYNDTTYGNTTALQGIPPNITSVTWSFSNPKGLNLTFSVDKMYLGNYTFTLTLQDDFGYTATDSVNVTIYKDLRAPIVDAVDEFEYEEGYSGYSLNWSAEENNPRSYNLTRDGEVLMNGTWRGENLTISIDHLDVGEYIYNMTLIDYFNQTTIKLTTLTVTPDAHNPLIQDVRVLETFTTISTNNITIQAYVWDINNLSLIEVEWTVNDNATILSLDMTLFGNDFFLASLGEFNHGDTIRYRVRAVDNSSVNNEYITEWIEYRVESMNTATTPALVWVGILAMGILSSIALLWIYFRTKTR